jgi:Mrp family chromosome partitioning ATPase
MSETCTHNCSTCSAECGERKEKFDFTAPANASSRIGKVIAVASGKGGVGKSFVTTALAVAASRLGLRTGILDADITGPSIPNAFGLKTGTVQSEAGLEPSVTDGGIRVMSLNMLVQDPSDPVVWRGPVLAGAVKQFWTDVHWGELDVMFVDMPPGTGDVPLTVYQSLPVDGVVIVSSPQKLVEMIVGKSVKMAQMMEKKVLGLVENMSYFMCPACAAKHELFGPSRAEELAGRFGIPQVVRLPIAPDYVQAVDAGAAETLSVPEIDAFVKTLI